MTGCELVTVSVHGQRGSAASEREAHLAKPAHADLGDAQARRNAAGMLRPRIDQRLAIVAARDADAQRRRIGAERVEQAPGALVDADHHAPSRPWKRSQRRACRTS